MKRFLCAAALCAGAAPAGAEIQTDGLWRGSGGAAMAATSGNTRSTSLQLTAEASRATADDKIALTGSGNYARGQVDGVNTTTASKWGGAGQYDVNLGPQSFAFVKLGLDGDRLIHLSLRTSLSGGLGYKLVQTEQNTVNLFGGVGYTTDHYSQPQSIDNRIGTRFSRASVYLGEESAHQLSPTVTLKQRLDVLPALGGDNALLVKFNASLAVAMSSTLNLSVGLVDTYNSKPPAGTRANDVGLFTGINVKFGAL